jgi:DNA-binding transcriptional ArsR family regulator
MKSPTKPATTTDAVFKALADTNRRYLLDQLRANDGQRLADLCENLKMSRQAVSKHLVILERANLITSLISGRHKLHYLNPVPLQEIVDRWMGAFKQHQTSALIALKNQLENDNDQNRT